MKTAPLTRPAFRKALQFLGDCDSDLGQVVATLGPPPMWVRKPGFPTIIRIILEQQVSLASAKAAFDRLRQSVPALTPDEFLKLGAEKLKQIGFSRQKTRYCRILSSEIKSGSLDLMKLDSVDDDRARAELCRITGIGRWTADIYLLMALRRPDVWPSGDLALASAAKRIKRLEALPSQKELESLSQEWKPWRAVAARILWHHYLSNSKSVLSFKF
jgi:DNA-3-methyladenine glycosylase II